MSIHFGSILMSIHFGLLLFALFVRGEVAKLAAAARSQNERPQFRIVHLLLQISGILLAVSSLVMSIVPPASQALVSQISVHCFSFLRSFIRCRLTQSWELCGSRSRFLPGC
jgi:hypothetical protein